MGRFTQRARLSRLIGRGLLVGVLVTFGLFIWSVFLESTRVPRIHFTPLKLAEQERQIWVAEVIVESTGRLRGDASGLLNIRLNRGLLKAQLPLVVAGEQPPDQIRLTVILPEAVDPEVVRSNSAVLGSAELTTSFTAQQRAVLIEVDGFGLDSHASLELSLPDQGMTNQQTSLLTIIRTLLLCIAFAFPLGALSYAGWLLHRSRNQLPKDLVPRASPPEEWPPALVGVLYDERATEREIAATILDLAHRGLVRLVEQHDQLLITTERSLLEARDFEQVLVNRLQLLTEDRSVMSVRAFDQPIALVYLLMYDATARLGVFVENPRLVHRKNVLIGTVTAAVGIVLILLGLFIRSAMIGIPLGGGALVAGLVIVGITSFTSVRTATGQKLLAEWLAFRQYLTSSEPITTDNLEEYYRWLPYAIVLQAEEEWTARHRRVRFQLPAWLLPARHGRLVQLKIFERYILDQLHQLTKILAQSSDPTIR